MESTELLTSLLAPVINATPHLLLCIVGLVLCLVRRRNLGAAATYGAIGFVLLLCGTLVGLSSHAWLIWMRQSSQTPIESLTLTMSAFGVVATVIHAIALGLLIAAIMVRRPAPAA